MSGGRRGERFDEVEVWRRSNSGEDRTVRADRSVQVPFGKS